MVDRIIEYLALHSNSLILAGCTITITILIGRRLRSRFLPYLYTLTGDTITSLDDAIVLTLSKLGPWFYSILGVRISSFLIVLPPSIEVLISILFTVIVIAQLGQGLLHVVLQLAKEKYFGNQETHNYTLITIFTKIIFWVIIFLLILTNLDIKITPLLASLGVVGIAVSFALQSILEDLFASVSIYLDKPFRLGDYITMGEEGGTVDHVGIKTTRIRTILGEELVVANRKLTDSIIHNYGKIDVRTITQDFTVPFDISESHQTGIPNMVKKACSFSELIEFQWCHLTKIGNFGLDYQLRYTLKSNDYATHLQIQEKILLNIIQSLANRGIKIVKKGIAQ